MAQRQEKRQKKQDRERTTTIEKTLQENKMLLPEKQTEDKMRDREATTRHRENEKSDSMRKEKMTTRQQWKGKRKNDN